MADSGFSLYYETSEEVTSDMTSKTMNDKLSIYIPQTKLKEQPVERLVELAKRRDRSVNYLVVEAILQFLEREDDE